VFQPLPAEWVQDCDIDAGLVETDPFTIDRQASLTRLIAFMDRRLSIIADELAVVGRLKPDLIVADIPFLAGDVAAAAGVSCLAISNFTWDWIYDHLFGDDSRYSSLRNSIADSYAKMSALLELPFGCTCPAIKRKIATPLIALESRRDPGEILRQLGLAPDDRRPRVLIGTRGTLNPEILAKAAADSPDLLFLCANESPATTPANGISVPLGLHLDFSDVLKISQVVVSKLGYGMISECICAQIPLVWPPRDGFVEDEIVAKNAPPFVPMVRMPIENYRDGQWGEFLREALNHRAAARSIPTNGARFCAELIAGHREGSRW
jgi:hypothetical protein